MPFLPLPLPFCRFVDFLPLPLNMVHFVPSNPVWTLYYYPSLLPPKPVSWCCFGIYLTGVPVAGSASWWPGQHSLSLRCDSGEQQQQRWRHATGTIIKPIVEKHVQLCPSKMFHTPVTPHETNLLLSEITVWPSSLPDVRGVDSVVKVWVFSKLNSFSRNGAWNNKSLYYLLVWKIAKLKEYPI